MSAGIQFVTQKAKEDKNVFGTLISMIDIPIKYQMALSVVAGYSFNDIVVKDNVTANKYIEMLKKNKTGIATFIPLDNIKIKNISNIKYENTLGYARDLVKNISGNESINKAINYVFSNAMVVEKIEDGLKLSKSLNDKIVSLDGDIISATGRITGGYNTRKIDNTLLKINELKELELKKETSFKELEKINKGITDIQSQFDSSREELENLKTNYSNYLHEKLKIQRELDTYTFEIDENNEFITSKTNEIKSNEELITAISKKIVSFFSSSSFNSLIFKRVDEKVKEFLNSYEKELKEVEINIAILREKEENLNSRYDEVRNDFNLILNEYTTIKEFLDKKDEIYSDISNNINKIKEEIESLNNNDIKLKENINNLNVEHKQLSDEHIKSLGEKSDLEIKIVSFENDINNFSENIKRLSEKQLNNDEKLLELEDEKEEILNNYEYQEITDEIYAKNVEKNVNINEKSRANIGSVNLESIEEYELEKNKYEKLINDKFDLLKSKDSILDLINEIDEDIITKFDKAITSITSNFEYMCKELLHNAKGTIRILNPEDMLETGVELSIKYKNKPEQTLTLLSGGEKSMLALSFILAIFMYKPSPFTFFDEVEAALDEANTKKIIKVLKEFIDRSQFILITHNKETMKGANRLYGVTMNKEIGESMIVNVDI